MNERIKELAEQATERVGVKIWDEYAGVFYTETHLKLNQEKFAELIVKECISKIEDELANAPCVEPREWGYVSGLSVATEIILQHFGVK